MLPTDSHGLNTNVKRPQLRVAVQGDLLQDGRPQQPLAPNPIGPPGAKGLVEWFKDTREFLDDPPPAEDIWRAWAI